MLPFTTYSILAVTLFQPRTIDFSDRVHFRLGIALQHEKRIVVELTTAEQLTCQYQYEGANVRKIAVLIFGVVPAVLICVLFLPGLTLEIANETAGRDTKRLILIVLGVSALIGTAALLYSVKGSPRWMTMTGLVCGIAAIIGSRILFISGGVGNLLFLAPVVVALFLMIEGITAAVQKKRYTADR